VMAAAWAGTKFGGVRVVSEEETRLLERHPERPGSDSINCQGANWVLMLTVELGASSWPLSTEAAAASIWSRLCPSRSAGRSRH
jgi:hypothetical protein